jgi:hypothetical protein
VVGARRGRPASGYSAALQPAQRSTAIDLLAARYAQYRAERPAGTVLAIAVDRWAGWSAAE